MPFLFDDLKDAAKEFVLEWEQNYFTGDSSDPSIRKEIRKEAVQFLEKCTSRLGNEIPVCVNPTMLHPTSHLWQVESAIPFDGYLPLTKEELITSSSDKILLRSCQNILKKLVSNYRFTDNVRRLPQSFSTWRMPWSSAMLKPKSLTSSTVPISQITLVY